MEVVIERRFQGIEGMAQGGHVAGLVASLLGGDLAVSFRSPCPLDTPLHLDGTRLLHGDTVVLEAEPAGELPEPPPFVHPEEAEEARQRVESTTHVQAISTCFSCGTGPDSFRVHAGPVDGVRWYASPVTHPRWTGPGNVVEHRFLWAPIDCAAGWRVSVGDRPAVTARLQVTVHADVAPGTPLVVVADADPDWDGRKRAARSAIYTSDGGLVASSGSLWVALA